MVALNIQTSLPNITFDLRELCVGRQRSSVPCAVALFIIIRGAATLLSFQDTFKGFNAPVLSRTTVSHHSELYVVFRKPPMSASAP